MRRVLIVEPIPAVGDTWACAGRDTAALESGKLSLVSNWPASYSLSSSVLHSTIRLR